jgi:hypothetical protein
MPATALSSGPMFTTDHLRRALTSVPDPSPAGGVDLAASLGYLTSDAALRSLEDDAYWPKWDSPWWHMLLLHELGEARRIPGRVVDKLVEALDALPLHIFPIHPEDSPPGTDPYRDSQCHCALGCITQVLNACGVDVDARLPWIKPWFVRYQMADGGLNCDSTAYLVTGECPSSMVGTIAPFEAMLLGPWSAEQTAFLDRGADFLVGRGLRFGSQSVHNGVEREREPSWLMPCFPRFYYYDVLRGAAALARWSAAAGKRVPLRAFAGVVEHLVAAFPDGLVRIGRRAYEGIGTLQKGDAGWGRVPEASRFPLLEQVSAVGDVSPPLTRQWAETRRTLLELVERGLIDDERLA